MDFLKKTINSDTEADLILFDLYCLYHSLADSFFSGGGWVVRRCWVNFQCQGILLIWIIVGQGPIALAVAGVVWTFFLSSITSLFFLPLSGRRTDID